MAVNQGAWPTRLMCALAGMLLVAGCMAPPAVVFGPDDAAVDRVWVAVQRGDLAGAVSAAEAIQQASLHERAALDIVAIRDGRSAALVACLDAGSWLAARYLASDEWALQRLQQARERMGPSESNEVGQHVGQELVVWLEEARRSAVGARRLSAARAAQGFTPGGMEALAMELETRLALGEVAAVSARLDKLEPITARLRLLRRQLDARSGQVVTAAQGLLDDLEQGQAVPTSLALLEEILTLIPLAELEARCLFGLREGSWPGTRMQRQVRRLEARLVARTGDLSAALGGVNALDPRSPAEDRWAARWEARQGGAPDESPEGRMEAEPTRDRSPMVDRLRLIDEWNLVARASYAEALMGNAADLDGFVETLDAAAASLPGSLALADMARNDYGLFGDLLDTVEIETHLPGTFLLVGKALGMPPEMTLYDVERRRDVPVEDTGDYREYHVRRLRVPGYAASQGAAFQGAALDRVVFLDRDEIDMVERWGGRGEGRPELAPRPAAGAEQRRDLREPFDVSERLRRAARAAAGEAYAARVLQTVALHEGQHIVDTREFLDRSLGGQLWSLAGAGLFPGAIRAAVERRAQLHALRHGDDPRIALAQCLDILPVEGARRFSEHAVGYGRLMAEFVAVLDADRSLAVGQLDRDAVLVQQLHRLQPETIRAIAEAIAD